jgi:putative FmdB family regulatory protein
MPVYAYRCENCGVQFEKVQKFTDKALTRCPECRKGTVRRVVQPSAIVFKGSGWYATDSRKSTERHASSASTSAKTETAAGDKPAADKPAASDKPAKPESKPAKAAAAD